ncbi:MAG: hypothetical protein JXC32_15500 [Anaerolineae bacterium]|nr:hypothetical protein [Anaerolineae bacterium]
MSMRLLHRLFATACALVLTLMAGCSQGASDASEISLAGAALSTDYEGALDAVSQLALGTLKLEETADAVTEAQAAELLPLWQALQSNALQGTDEATAVQKQIEGALTDAQLSAIQAMQLTEEDAQAWAEEAGAGMGMPGGFPGEASAGGLSEEDRAAMREQMREMTDEDRAALREQMGAGGAGPGREAPAGGEAGGGGSSRQLMMAVVQLLASRSGQEGQLMPPFGEGGPGERPAPGERPDDPAAVELLEVPEPTATETPQAEAYDEDEASPPSSDPAAEATSEEAALPVAESAEQPPDPDAESTVEPERVDAVAATQEPEATESGREPIEEPTIAAEVDTEPETAVATASTAAADAEPTSAELVAVANTTAAVAQPAAAAAPAATPALVQVPDTNPGPPFSVEISLNRAEPSPLLDGLTIYKVSGLLTNDGDEVYAVNTVHFTFYDADGFRGAFYQFARRRYGEWIPHGAMAADFDCMLLAPGESCPFTAEIAAYNMGSFYVHADAVVAEWREPAPVEVAGSKLIDQGSSVRITGTIVNNNTYAIKNVVICGALVDANGQITSIGSDYTVQSIAPGASVTFDAPIPADDYVTYQVFAQAEGDFN